MHFYLPGRFYIGSSGASSEGEGNGGGQDDGAPMGEHTGTLNATDMVAEQGRKALLHGPLGKGSLGRGSVAERIDRMFEAGRKAIREGEDWRTILNPGMLAEPPGLDSKEDLGKLKRGGDGLGFVIKE